MKISFNNVSYWYNNKDKPALDNINVELFSNEIIFILGHTGSGKSTFVQHLNGLLFPSSGEVIVDVGDSVFHVNNKEKAIKQLRKNVGLVFQFPENQLFESTVLKDVMFGPLNFGYDMAEAEKLAKASLNLLGLGEEYYQRSPFELSGGEKRKVAIAGVIASKPKILVLDEPTSSLDSRSRKELFETLVMLKEKGIMIIVVSHDVDLCYEYADKVIILTEGKVAYYGDYYNAFTNEDILESANIELPFVFKAKNKLKVEKNVRNVKDLIKEYREESHNE